MNAHAFTVVAMACDRSSTAAVHYGTDVKVSFFKFPGPNIELVIDFGFAMIAARIPDDILDLYEAFQLQGEAVAQCRRYAFTLAEVEDDAGQRVGVVYTDKRDEIRMSRQTYDEAAAAMTELLSDPLVQSTLRMNNRELPSTGRDQSRDR